jgi:mono/diheme cytochrome c family protein
MPCEAMIEPGICRLYGLAENTEIFTPFLRTTLMKLLSQISLSGAITCLTLLTPCIETEASDANLGSELFAQRCAMCHGEKGAGDGPLAATMPADQKPRDLSKGDYKYATDKGKLIEVISKGGANVGLSVLMPAQSDLNQAQLEALADFVSSLKTS